MKWQYWKSTWYMIHGDDVVTAVVFAVLIAGLVWG